MKQMFYYLCKPSPQTFHILLHGFANAKDKEGVVFIFSEMRKSRATDAMAFNSKFVIVSDSQVAITAVANAGDQLGVLEYLHEMLTKKWIPGTPFM